MSAEPLRPPQPPRTGLLGAVERTEVGTLARSTAPHAPGIALLAADARLDDLAAAFADAGVSALALDEADDVAVATQRLRDEGAPAVYAFGIGPCGTTAILAANAHDLAGAVAIAAAPPVDEARTGTLTAPVLALYAGADETVDEERVEAFHAALAAAGTLQETVVYDGAPAGFFAAEGGHREACDDAWRRILRFLGVPAY